MFAVFACQSVCLSRGLSRPHCAKIAEQIKILFGVNTHGGPYNIALDVGADSPHREGRGGPTFKFLDPLLSSERLKLETWNFACIQRDGDPNENYAHTPTAADQKQRQIGYSGILGWSRDLLLNSATAYISQKRLQLESPERAVCAVHSMQPLLNYFGLLLS